MPQGGTHAVTVPGAVAGWAALHASFRTDDAGVGAGAGHGDCARGFPVSELTAAEWRGSLAPLRAHPTAGRTFLPDGGRHTRARCSGIPIWRARYAQLAAAGRDAFYEGEIATPAAGLLGQTSAA